VTNVTKRGDLGHIFAAGSSVLMDPKEVSDLSLSIKKVLVQVAIATVIMLGVAAISLVTATAGVDPKDLPPAYAQTETAVQGRQVFQTSGCASCHQIMRQGGNGADLTHVGDKYSRQEIADLIRNPRKYLPSGSGDFMPAVSKKDLSDEDLKAVSKYLSTLKDERGGTNAH
jgi:mono/diheme cytochrome c family protein